MGSSSNSAKSKPAANGKSKSRSGSPVLRFLRACLLRPGRVLMAVLAIGGIAAFPKLVQLLPRLSELPEYQFALSRIDVNPPGEWVPATIVDDVHRAAHLPATVSLLDADTPRIVAAAWSSHPWVREVRSVRVTDDQRVRVNVAYRTPAAFVEVAGGGMYPVDVGGTLLPPADFSMSQVSRLPHLRGVVTTPRGPAGAEWGDNVVTAGAQLASLLAPGGDLEKYWNRYDLEAIVAPANAAPADSPETFVFELAMRNGNRIVWGKPPGADALEQPANKKLERLELIARPETGDSLRDGPYTFDIRLFDRITYAPREPRYH